MESTNVVKSGFALATEKVNDWGSEFYLILPNIVVGLVVLAVFTLAGWGFRRALRAYFNRKGRKDLGRLLSDFSFWITIMLGVMIFFTIVIPSLRPVDLLSSLGLGSLAFGFAFKDILQNWLAGLLILLRLPFRRGDQIRVGDAEGTVQAIEPRATIIRTYDGRDIIVPNTTIYTNIVTVNTAQISRRVEIDLTVGYSYDIRRIIEIIQSAIKPIEQIIPDPPPQVLCWELGATSLGVKVRWWISPERSQEVTSRARIIQAIKEAFDANDIDPTDPQLIYYKRQLKKPVSVSGEEETEFNTIEKADNGPPPELVVSKKDPESAQPKIDSKADTLLSD